MHPSQPAVEPPAAPAEATLAAKLAQLEWDLLQATSGGQLAAVAFSGGADSAFVLAACARALGPARVVAVTAVSPSLAESELVAARAFADSLGVAHLLPASAELERPGYRENSPARCFHCKTEVIAVVHAEAAGLAAERPAEAAELAAERPAEAAGLAAERPAEAAGLAGEQPPGVVVMTGTNADDLRAEHRPGIVAARRLGAITPIGGFTKDEVRQASRLWDLPTWDKPAQACLASRIAYGVTVTADALLRVQRSEAALRALFAERGWVVADLRVRDRGDGAATIELDRSRVGAAAADPAVVEAVISCGFTSAEVDPIGFRSGSMNEALRGA